MMAGLAALLEITTAGPGPINGCSDPLLVSYLAVLLLSIHRRPIIVTILNFEDKQADGSDLEQQKYS
jgi:hypothetical protein